MDKDKETTLIEKLEKSSVIQGMQKDISWIKWVMGFLFALIIAQTGLFIGIVTYLHSDTKASIQNLKTSIEASVERLENRIQQVEIRLNMVHPPKMAKK